MPRKTPPPDKAALTETGLSGDWSTEKALLQERKEQLLADRVELQTRIIRKDLLLRDIFKGAMGRIFCVYSNQINVISDFAGDVIAARLRLSDGVKTATIRTIISDFSYGMTGTIKQELEKFVKSL